MAVMDYGAWREQVCVPAVHVYRLPESMDFVTAAGFPVTYGTSHIGLDHRGGLKAGETLLVHGAAGGVGLTAVEIGKAMGATVIATAGGPKRWRWLSITARTTASTTGARISARG